MIFPIKNIQTLYQKIAIDHSQVFKILKNLAFLIWNENYAT